MRIDNLQLPPHSVESEEAFLGSILLWGCESPERVIPISQKVQASDFSRELNAWIYQAMLDLLREGMGVDMITVAHRLKSKNQLDETYDNNKNRQGLPTPAYFYHLLNAVPTSLHMEHYANIVLDCSQRRQLMLKGAEMVKNAYAGNRPPTPIRKGLKFE